MESSKVFMVPDGTSKSLDPNLLLSQMSNGGFGNNGNWMWIIFLFFLYGWGGNGFFGREGAAGAVASSTERDMLLQAINGNGAAIGNLATTLNCDINSVKTAINSVQNAVSSVGNQVGLSGQQVINAIQQGNMSICQQFAQCCCDNKLLVTQMGYEGQLRDLTNTCAITNRISELANGVQTGFANIGYNQATNTSNIIQAGNANTQRIIDTLNNHWTSDLQQRYADARLELSQLSLNAYLISLLKTTA